MNKLIQYLEFAQAYPAMFTNLEGEITILLEQDEIRNVEAIAAQRLKQKQLPTEWAEVGIVYTDQYQFILRDAVRFPNGELGTYIRIIQPPKSSRGVVILPVYQDKVLLIRHFRHATRNWHIEIPRGFGEQDLSSQENAERELIEEISTKPLHLISIGEMHVNTGITSQCVDIFYTQIESIGKPDYAEGIKSYLLVEVLELERMIRDREITDSFTIAAYTQAKLHRLL